MNKKVFNFGIPFFILVMTLCGFGQLTDSQSDAARKNGLGTCPSNPDKRYSRGEVLGSLAAFLNSAVPQYKTRFGEFFVKEERARGFFVFDLTDTSNRQRLLSDCVNFVNDHIYHFAPRYLPLSFSQIVILEDGNLKFFKSINCEVAGSNTIGEVLTYIGNKLRNSQDKDEIIGRVKDYRRFGSYGTLDETDIDCKSVRIRVEDKPS